MKKEEGTEKQVLVGHITKYIYTSSDSLYKVCLLETTKEEEITIVGSFPRLEDGLNYEFIGVMKEHTKYGEQFFVESYAKSNSYTKEGLIHYLSSERFRGIGPKLAENIVDELGLNCIELILKDPEELNRVYGLTKGKKEVLIDTIQKNYLEDQVFIRLYGFGLTSKMIQRLYEIYGVTAANVVEENPYTLITEVEGFGFKKCDALALNLGFKLNDIKRIQAALLYTLTYVCYQQGFTFLTMEQLTSSTKKLLDNHPLITNDDLSFALEDLISSNKICVEENRVFETALFHSEVKCSEKLRKLYETKSKNTFPVEKVRSTLTYIEELIGIHYTPLQKDAIVSSLSNKLSIITGGPGTGKSTILNGILHAYAELNNASLTDDEMQLKILLVAPTGRAAKRMSETTNFKASTIHKALGFTYDGFMYNEYNLLSCGLVIIDEASMLDMDLAAKFFVSLPNTCSVILVGDANQLPSVGPGNVLSDLMSSSIFKTTKLTQIMRQAKDSNIIKLSHMILSEQISYDIFSSRKEVFFYPYEAKDIIQGLFRILDNYIKSGGSLQTDMQILVPMYAGVAGIDAINTAIQARYNAKSEKFIQRDFQLFKVNDKVLQLKNDSELDIMNGDIGKIIDIVKVEDKDALLIDFDGRVVTYYAKNLDNLKLAYAISIHKSQGSEFQNVIMPILFSYQIMLKKKILYTGITRAKSKLILLGSLEAIDRATKTQDYPRQTALLERIDKKVLHSERIFDSTIPFDTFGEYDMEGITPYTFMN